eukprot:CAMPEP_0113869100 /NCGR_PEP_ID=MMETSP0780_2-20120614/1351_1 /TAXON_ID=652834 /ORGANISM="Palpitomonas bilix" /LENGTH=88 /DNA_ID=CAMNT_0000854245 /DNA_START=40 /DNA_END=306 /DNA_ORIENTATION=+ /assembly_acc=CAM_ASM_000599
MSTPITSAQVLSLYKQLLRSARLFKDYNFRDYAIRRTKVGFRENAHLSDPAEIRQAYAYGFEQLGVIRRQTLISQLYYSEKNIMEVPH